MAAGSVSTSFGLEKPRPHDSLLPLDEAPRASGMSKSHFQFADNSAGILVDKTGGLGSSIRVVLYLSTVNGEE